LSYSVGFSLPGDLASIQKKLASIPDDAWTPAHDADRQVRPGAFVAEVTGLFDLTSWPTGMRLIVRKERPHPGAQLRITDIEGMRITAFVTNTARGQLADLELRHRRRARAEDRIRAAKDTGLTNLPLHDFAQNEIWCALVALAADLVAWMQTRALTGHEARRWEPKRLRLRLLSHPGTARPHRPPPAAAPGRHRALHRPRPTGPRRARPAGRASRDSSAGLTPASSIPATAAMTGPWNRRPPERPRPNRHTHMPASRRRGARTPTTIGMIMTMKDPG
jgi:hypothetical protein